MTAFPDTLKHGSGASLTREPDRLLVSLASGAKIRRARNGCAR